MPASRARRHACGVVNRRVEGTRQVSAAAWAAAPWINAAPEPALAVRPAGQAVPVVRAAPGRPGAAG